MRSSRAALGGGFDVNLRVPSKQNEAICWRLNVRSECRTSEILAISAVTNRNHSGIDIRLKRDLAAMTTAINLHGAFLLSHTIGWRPLDTRAFFFRPGAGNLNARRLASGLSTEGSDYEVPTSVKRLSVTRKAHLARTKNAGAGQDTPPWLAPFPSD